MENYSVLMTVYIKDNPDYMRLGIDSMLKQTVKTNDFVLVCDGPITDTQNDMIALYQERNPGLFNVIRLQENVGLGVALQSGLLVCRNEIVARMDNDDIAIPERCEKELQAICTHNDVSVVGSYVNEFDGSIDNVLKLKKVPTSYEDIKAFARRRNPFNHSTVMLRKSDVISAGSYSDMRTNQDVELWVRMLNKGYKGLNLAEALVSFRFDVGTYDRRRDKRNVILMINVWKGFWKKHYCGLTDYLYVALIQIGIMIIPKTLLMRAYNRFR